MTETITKAMLAERLLPIIDNLSKQEATAIVDYFFETIGDRLIEGEMVKISGFGNFVLRDKKSRPGRNPKTGEEAVISARRVVTFRAGQKLKAKVKHFNIGA